MNKCESCVFYPPSSFGGRPCAHCDTSNPYMNCYHKRGDNKRTYANALKEMYADEMARTICDIVKDISGVEINRESVIVKLESFVE